MNHRTHLVLVLAVALVGLPGCKKLLRKRYSATDAGITSSSTSDPDPIVPSAGGTDDEVTPKYVDAKGGFSVAFPSGKTPSKDSQKIAGMDLFSYTVTDGAAAYMLGYSDVPAFNPKITPPEKILDDARDGAVKNVSGTLDSEKKVKIGGFPGRDVTAHTKMQGIEIQIRLRAYLVGRRLYQMNVTTPARLASASNAAATDAYFDSFALLGDAGAK